jgi:hypothetical protein
VFKLSRTSPIFEKRSNFGWMMEVKDEKEEDPF